MATLVKERLGHKYHWAVADYLQRAARHLASKTDLEQAYAVGVAAVELALAGSNAVMPAIVRTSDAPYRWKIGVAPLDRVANVEKKMPRDFISADGFGITRQGATLLIAAHPRRRLSAVQGRPAALRAAEEHRRAEEARHGVRALTRTAARFGSTLRTRRWQNSALSRLRPRGRVGLAHARHGAGEGIGPAGGEAGVRRRRRPG